MSAKKREVEEEQSEGAPEWMTTYSDLVTLLLTFFILLFSMAVIDKQKFVEVANSLRSTLSHNSNGELLNQNGGKRLVTVMQQSPPLDDGNFAANDIHNKKSQGSGTDDSKKKLDKAISEMQKEIKDLKLSGFVKVIEHQEQIILRIDSVVIFESGKADLKYSAIPVLKKLGNVLKPLDNEILVQGHTDNRPIKTKLFPSNWELSTKRATNVVTFLINSCSLKPDQLTATGSAEFKNIVPNNSEANRAKNRRIDIVIDK